MPNRFGSNRVWKANFASVILNQNNLNNWGIIARAVNAKDAKSVKLCKADNTEPSPLREGVETRGVPSLIGEDGIVRTAWRHAERAEMPRRLFIQVSKSNSTGSDQTPDLAVHWNQSRSLVAA